jgi:peptide/nickel transport system permease protein
MKAGKKNINFIIGSAIIGLIILVCIIGMIHTPYDPNKMNGAIKSMPPNIFHPFGTDNFGRDILSRVMVGARTTFLVAIFTIVIGGVVGTIIGALTGYYGGWIDEIIMRINDGVTSFPSILLALVLVSIMGPGTYNVIIALGIIFIPSFARVVRSEYITLKQMDFVKNAKLMGASNLRIMFIHMLPNIKHRHHLGFAQA